MTSKTDKIPATDFHGRKALVATLVGLQVHSVPSLLLQEHQYHQIWFRFHLVERLLRQSCSHTHPWQDSANLKVIHGNKLELWIYFFSIKAGDNTLRFWDGFFDIVSCSFNLKIVASRLRMINSRNELQTRAKRKSIYTYRKAKKNYLSRGRYNLSPLIDGWRHVYR